MNLDFKKLCEISGRSLSEIIGGASYGNYEFGFDCKKEDYQEARKKLKDPCYEDVLAKVLEMGKPVFIIDYEDEEHKENPEKWTLTKQKLNNGVEAFFKDCKNQISDFFTNPDFYTDWNFIQCCLFGEVVYG